MEKKKIEWNKIVNQVLKDPRTWILFVLLFVVIISCIPRENKINVNKNDEKIRNKDVEIVTKEKEYKVKFNIVFKENVVFSRYDVRIKTDGVNELLEHGEDKEFEAELKEGKRTITFVKDDDSDIKETITLNVTSNMEVSYKISCYNDRIEVEELYIDKDENISDNQIKIDFDSSKFNKKDYKDVVKELTELGFTNIEEKPIYDIYWNITPEGEIEDVTIDGDTNYKRGNVYNKDVKIVVSYHMKDDDDPNKAHSPYNKYYFGTITYQEAEQAYKDAGFTNITLEVKDTTSSGEDGKVSSITIDGETPNKDDMYNKDAKIIIKYYKYKQKESSESNNTDNDPYGDNKHYTLAKTNFENEGKSRYPYGIKFHWWVGLRDFTYKGNGVWHIEVDVDVTNKYGAKKEGIASGNVDFKAEKVKDFVVKNKY